MLVLHQFQYLLGPILIVSYDRLDGKQDFLHLSVIALPVILAASPNCTIHEQG
jgi:hypothetical protein